MLIFIAKGSGNGLAAAINCLNPLVAAYCIVKGFTSPLDICSVIQGEERFYSFLGLAWCILADVDRESEKYRKLMGGFRFTFTAVQKVFDVKEYEGKISFIPAKLEKRQCKAPCQICRQANQISRQQEDSVKSTSEVSEEVKTKGPDLVNLEYMRTHPDEVKVVGPQKFSWFQSATVTHISYDAKVAPWAHNCDGLIDLTYSTKKLGTLEMTKALLGLEDGDHVKVHGLEYQKTKAFILEPISKNGQFVAKMHFLFF